MEMWKAIKGFEGLYEVSDLGRVRALPRTVWNNGRQKWDHRKGMILKPRINSNGYWVTQLHHNGKVKYLIIHRLLAEAFIPNPENKSNVNHKNGIRSDNSLDNLEWVTPSANCLHAYRILHRTPPWIAEDHHWAKLTNKQVIEIKERLKNYYKGLGKKLAYEFNISSQTICNIRKDRIWRTIAQS